MKQEEEEKPYAKEQGAMEGVEFSRLGVGEFWAIPQCPVLLEMWESLTFLLWDRDVGAEGRQRARGESFIVGKVKVLGG